MIYNFGAFGAVTQGNSTSSVASKTGHLKLIIRGSKKKNNVEFLQKNCD